MTARLDEWRDMFVALLGEKAVLHEADDLEAYSVDETHEHKYMPDLVLKPSDTTQIAAVLKTCNTHKIPVVPRGGGSGVSGGALALHGGVILCMERLNRILEIDAANMTATVETGVITGELQDKLRERGFSLPPDPGSKAYCQIGGNLAESAGGPKSVKYGVFKDYVLSLEAVLPNGGIIHTGANVRKTACGYNLTQLLLGSEGTLAVITRVTFRLCSAPTESLVLRLAFQDLAAAGAMICKVFEAGLTPSELEFIERDAVSVTRPFCSDQVEGDPAALLWIGFDGNDAARLMADAEKAGELAEALGASEVLFAEDPAQQDKLWEYRRKVGEAIIESTTFRDVDVSFPRSKLYEMVSATKEIGRKYGFDTACFGHCGDGNIHIHVLRGELDEAAWNGPVQTGIGELYAQAQKLGGTLSGEHGIGCMLNRYMGLVFGEAELALMRGIKQVFDPNGILNPGKIFPS